MLARDAEDQSINQPTNQSIDYIINPYPSIDSLINQSNIFVVVFQRAVAIKKPVRKIRSKW